MQIMCRQIYNYKNMVIIDARSRQAYRRQDLANGSKQLHKLAQYRSKVGQNQRLEYLGGGGGGGVIKQLLL